MDEPSSTKITAGTERSDERTSDRPSAVPRTCTLDGFIEASTDAGIHIDQLDPLTELIVRTWNSVYHILVVDPHGSKILIRGGRWFPVSVAATLAGSGFGGSFLKTRWIGVGFRMELNVEGFDGLVIITSPVCSIALDASVAGRPS